MKNIIVTITKEVEYSWEKEKFGDLYVKDVELRGEYIWIWSPMDGWHNTHHTPEQLFSLGYISQVIR